MRAAPHLHILMLNIPSFNFYAAGNHTAKTANIKMLLAVRDYSDHIIFWTSLERASCILSRLTALHMFYFSTRLAFAEALSSMARWEIGMI